MSSLDQPSSDKKEIPVSKEQLGGIADMLVNRLRTRYKGIAMPPYAEDLSVNNITFVIEKYVEPNSKIESIAINANDGKGGIAFGLDLKTGELGSELLLTPEQLQTVKDILGQ